MDSLKISFLDMVKCIGRENIAPFTENSLTRPYIFALFLSKINKAGNGLRDGGFSSSAKQPLLPDVAQTEFLIQLYGMP